MTIVVFSPATFTQRYPEFNTVDPILLGLYFNEACLYLNNTDGSPVTDIALRAVMLNMITAHIACLNSVVNGVVANPLVGRISSASEGSVHVTVEDGKPSSYPAWFKQTQYGSSYWQISNQYRRMRYIPACGPQTIDIPRGD
jgi:hypothetical protein